MHMHFLDLSGFIAYVVSQMYSQCPPTHHNFIGQNWVRVNTGICFQAKWSTKSATSVSSVLNFKKRFEAVQAMNWSYTKRKFQ